MSWESPGKKLGNLTAAADLSAKQYFALKVDSSGNLAVAGAGQRSIMVLQNAPESGDACEAMIDGVTKASAGGTITAGDPVAVDSAGEFVKALDNDYQIGVALASAVDGDVFPLWLTGGQGLSEITSPA